MPRQPEYILTVSAKAADLPHRMTLEKLLHKYGNRAAIFDSDTWKEERIPHGSYGISFGRKVDRDEFSSTLSNFFPGLRLEKSTD